MTVGAFAENCYLVVDEQQKVCVLVDPGEEGERLLAAVRASGATLQAIWLTHAHLDHIGGVAAVRREMDVPIYLHPADMPLYLMADRQAAMYGLPFEVPPLPDAELAAGDVVRVGRHAFEVMHTPGHAPGHVIFHGNGVAFGGDCLFAGSIGRTDLPLSVPADLTGSLERIVALPGSTVVYPGHGPHTTIGRELVENPFLNGAVRVPGG